MKWHVGSTTFTDSRANIRDLELQLQRPNTTNLNYNLSLKHFGLVVGAGFIDIYFIASFAFKSLFFASLTLIEYSSNLIMTLL